MSFTALSQRIEASFGTLSPSLRKAARHLLRCPDDVALKSMRQLAADAGVPPATMVRLARALGFAAFDELRRPFKDRLRWGEKGGYGDRARAIQAFGNRSDDVHPFGALIRQSFECDIDNLRRTAAQLAPEDLEACAAALSAARRIYVVGLRSAFGIAYFFDYACRLFGAATQLLDDRGGASTDALRGLGPADVVCACSIEPYTRRTVEIVRFARSRGASVVAITDSRVSPVARDASHVLVVACESPSFFGSLAGALSVVQLVVALLIARGGDTALAALAESEAQLKAFDAYWEESGDARARHLARGGERP